MSKNQRKRVDVVSVKLCKESSILYEPRKIAVPEDGANLLRRFLADSDREQFLVVTLDTKNQPINVNVCSVGTLNSSLVHPREIFKVAILSNANSIIIGHNHPSGNPEPSKEDLSITKRIKEAGEIIGIKLTDHLILGEEEKFVSLKERGIL
jgi:DNA repair protein RadC